MNGIEINRSEVEADIEKVRVQLDEERQREVFGNREVKTNEKKIIEDIIFKRFSLEKDASPDIKEQGKKLLYFSMFTYCIGVAAITFFLNFSLLLSLVFYIVSGVLAMTLVGTYLSGVQNSPRKIIRNLKKAANSGVLSIDSSIKVSEALNIYKSKLAFAKSVDDDEIIVRRLDKQYFDEMVSSLLKGI